MVTDSDWVHSAGSSGGAAGGCPPQRVVRSPSAVRLVFPSRQRKIFRSLDMATVGGSARDMTALSPVSSPGYGIDLSGSLAQAVRGVAERGYAVVPDFVGADLVSELRAACLGAWQGQRFRPAGVGRGVELRIRPEIRNDAVLWLDSLETLGAVQRYRDVLEGLRRAVNRELYLGLVDFEGHLSVYPAGAYYHRHLDQFRGIGLRTLTCVLYLNEGWLPEDGGELRIYLEKQAVSPHVDVLPVGGTLVAFLSADFFHEVLPARRPRLAVTGWFKRRA